jgi:Skp family chaperone for outer membrane proteins
VSHRTTAARFAGLARIALPAMALAGVIALAAGCDKAGNKTATPPANGSATVGVVDYDRVFKEMNWLNEIDKDLQATGAELKNAAQPWEDQITAAVNAEKAKIAAAAHLNDRQIDDLKNNRDLDKLPLSADQRIELNQSLYNANGYAQRVQAGANEIIQQRKLQVVNVYRDSLKPSVRRVAENNGLLMIVTPVDSVVYYSPTVDMTNKVIDDLRQAPPPHNLPEPPKLPQPKGPIQLTVPPTTAPVVPAVGPTTRGSK